MMFKKVPPKAALFDHVKGNANAQDFAIAQFQKRLQQLYDTYFLRVTRFIANPNNFSKTDAINLRDASAAIGQLTEILIDSGYEDVVGMYADQFPYLTARALSYFKAFGVDSSLAGIDEEQLHVLINFGQKELEQTISSALISPVESHMLQAAIGNVDRAELVSTVLELSNVASTARAEVLVDDIYAQYQRAVTVQKAAVLEMEIFQYLGPDDAITSDQCEAMLHVNKHGVDGVLYKDEITVDLHPKLTRSPLVGGGHPRCRHQWSPLSEAFAKESGFKPRAGDAPADDQEEAA